MPSSIALSTMDFDICKTKKEVCVFRIDESMHLFDFIKFYLRLISLTTLVHVIWMRPRLLLKVPAKNYDPAKLLW